MKESRQMDVKKYIQVIKSRKYVFIAVSLLVMSIIIWGSYFLPKLYKAESTVFIERNIIKNLVKGMVVTPSVTDRLRILTYAMNSREMLMKVVKALDLDVEAQGPAEIESVINNFRRNTNITTKGKDLFKVSYVGEDPKLIRDYINTLISIYVEENTSSKRAETQSANVFLADQIEHYRGKLEEADDNLSRFRIEKGIYYAANEKTMVSSIRSNKEEIDKTNVAIRELNAREKELESMLSGEKEVPRYALKQAKDELGDSLEKLESYLSMLKVKYTEKHPEVIKTKSDIANIKEQLTLTRKENLAAAENSSTRKVEKIDADDPIFVQLQEALLLVRSQLASGKAKLDSLKHSINNVESELRNMPEDKKVLSGLMRQRDTYQDIYEQLLSRLGQAEVSKQMELEDKGTNFRIVDPAILPTTPFSPDRIKFMLLGIIGGLAAGLGIILVLEHFDHSIKDVDSLKEKFGYSVFAVIPTIVTEEEMTRTRRIDWTVYGISLAYFSVVVGLLLKEVAARFL